MLFLSFEIISKINFYNWNITLNYALICTLKMRGRLCASNEIRLALVTDIRSSHQRCSIKKGVLRNFRELIGKHLCQSPFLNKVSGIRPATLFKKGLWHRGFPVNFVKFLRTPFLQNTSGELLP